MYRKSSRQAWCIRTSRCLAGEYAAITERGCVECSNSIAQRNGMHQEAEKMKNVWSYGFVHHRTDDGRAFRTLNILDEFSRECLEIRVKRKLNSTDVVDALTDLFILRGIPAFIRSDNGPEFIAEIVCNWISAVGAKTAYIEPGSPWENGYCETFNARLRDALLNGEVFYTLKEAQIIIEQWRKHYNTKRPHSALGYRPPVPETIIPMDQRPIMH